MSRGSGGGRSELGVLTSGRGGRPPDSGAADSGWPDSGPSSRRALATTWRVLYPTDVPYFWNPI